ncbi:MAG: hypothetical protein JXR41_16055 [Bacteroidales bacterium]|nr:hypothetical protein [Bacteroidales bacterium]MBN2764610.1 hypothetical protein [Bacteroidales bacterium]
MQSLNLRELILIIAGITILTGFLIVYLKYTASHIHGILHWAIGTFLIGTGLVAYGLYPRPVEYVNLIITNVFAVTGQCLFLTAVWKFKEKPVNFYFVFTIPVLAFLSTTVFTLFLRHMGLRVSINSILYTVSAGYCFYEMLRPHDKAYKLIFQINALVILIYILAMLIRIFVSLSLKELDLMAPTPESIILFLAISLTVIILTFGFIIMVNIRLSQDLIRQNAMKDKFFSIIAHDLKNPMNNIMGFSDLLSVKLQENNREETVYMSRAIKQSVTQINTLLENLLEWALSQTGKVRYLPEKINLRDFITEEYKYYLPFAESKKLSLDTEGITAICVWADNNMLKTIMRNLITNAIKYTHSGGTISIRSEQQLSFAEVSVSDTGIGIEETTMKTLFSFDDKMTTRGTQDEKGSGLGLVLCKEFVERNGGSIWVKSEPGKGSTVYFTLPLCVS